MSPRLDRDKPRRRPVIDPDLSAGKQYGYRDPYRHADAVVIYGPPPATPVPLRHPRRPARASIPIPGGSL